VSNDCRICKNENKKNKATYIIAVWYGLVDSGDALGADEVVQVLRQALELRVLLLLLVDLLALK
jgi:hypothetical protein